MKNLTDSQTPAPLLAEIRNLIAEARQAVATAVNAGLTMLYWRIGKRIHEEVLKGERAAYGEKIVNALSAQLVAEYGSSFKEKSLHRMVQFAEVFPDEDIVVALIRQLSWTHFLALIPIKDPLKRDFYAEMCRIDRWSSRTLRERIDSMLFERTALSKKPEELARLELAALREEDRMTPDLVLRDPYVLDFLGLRDRYLERDLEDAIMVPKNCVICDKVHGITSGHENVAVGKMITPADVVPVCCSVAHY